MTYETLPYQVGTRVTTTKSFRPHNIEEKERGTISGSRKTASGIGWSYQVHFWRTDTVMWIWDGYLNYESVPVEVNWDGWRELS